MELATLNLAQWVDGKRPNFFCVLKVSTWQDQVYTRNRNLSIYLFDDAPSCLWRSDPLAPLINLTAHENCLPDCGANYDNVIPTSRWLR